MKKRKLIILMGIATTLCLVSTQAQIGDEAPQHDERIKRILRAENIDYTIDKDGDFKVVQDMGRGRTQLAFIMSNTSEYRNFEIREIWSIGYKSTTEQFPSSVANQLLEDSFPKKLGAWTKNGKHAIFMVRLSANANAESLVSALKFALEVADEMEEELSGDRDEF